MKRKIKKLSKRIFVGVRFLFILIRVNAFLATLCCSFNAKSILHRKKPKKAQISHVLFSEKLHKYHTNRIILKKEKEIV